ncbi:MAG: DoxX family protein [Rhodothermales bacterium]
MKELLEKIRRTKDEKGVGVLRIIMGLIIMMSGWMKFLVPTLREAWSGQLLQANLPLYEVNFWVIPVVEIVVGSLLAVGFFSRLGALVVLGMMVVAAYVHLVVDDPSLFPLQPHQPIIPLMLIAIGAYVLWRGGGSWSRDLRSQKK